MDSILSSIKKLLGIDESYEHFDGDIIFHINSALMALTQIGVGPEEGFSISDKTATWNNFIGTDKLESAKLYIFCKVRLGFDPPSSSFVLEAIERQAKELEWRLNVQVDKPVPEVIVEEV